MKTPKPDLSGSKPETSAQGARRQAVHSGPSRRFAENERGHIAILFAMFIIPIVGIVGASVDIGRAMAVKSQLQGAADAAATTAAQATLETNLVPDRAGELAFHANITSASAPISVTPQVVVEGHAATVSATASVPTTFMKIMQINEIPVTVRAAASVAEVEDEDEETGNACILLKSPDRTQALLVNGSADIIARDCEVHVHSTASPAVMMNSNLTFDVKKTCIAGANYSQNGGGHGAIGPIEPSCNVASDIYANTLPTPTIGSCAFNNHTFNGKKNEPIDLSPGVYCGNTTFNGNVTINMAPGLYIIKNGKWMVNGNSVTQGSGVTIYLADTQSYIQWNGNSQIDLQAPTYGTYKDILMFEPPNLPYTTQMTVNGNNGSYVRGLWYLPSRDMTWNGNSGLSADAVTMVFNTLILNGNVGWRFDELDTFPIPAPGAGGKKKGRVYLTQ